MNAPVFLLALPLLGPLAGDGVVAVQAGTIHLVENGALIEGGGTIVLRDGKIVAVGADVEVPAGARVVSYGEDAVIVPGLVAADSSYGASFAAPRTASPTLRALDNFDPYTNLYPALRDGITTIYIAPARGRLIAGQGAVVKTFGDPDGERVLSESASIHGSIAAEARSTPGYWVPPVPATVDVGLGVEQRQLPRTTMGAVVALRELLAYAGGDASLAEEYGIETGPKLAELMEAGRAWRMGADSPEELRALLEVFGQAQLPLVIEGASGVSGSSAVAEEIAAAGVGVIAGPNHRGTADFGKGPQAAWPRYDVVSTLAGAGVKVAIAARRSGDLRFVAGLAMHGGLEADAALRAITLAPAELLGVADRVGSIAPGKDADFVVLNGPPLAATTGVIATWVDGDVAWKPKESSATVLEVDELHLGDGRVLSPGQLLMMDGKIREVGTRVAHPRGATVVRGAAAMPGMIDALGHLGLEGSKKSFSSRTDLRRIVEPGDYTDRRVAKAGVTTVHMGSRSASGNSLTMAYKPAGTDHARMVIAAPAALRMTWTQDNRATSGEAVRKTLGKAAEYKQKWEEYEKAIAEWTPAPAEPAEEVEDGGEDEEQDEDDDKDNDKDEDDDKKKKKKKKKKKGEKDPPRPVTGEWNGTLKVGDETFAMRLRLLECDLALEGTVRIEGQDELVALTGRREEYEVTLEGRADTARITIELELDGDALSGKGSDGAGIEGEIALQRTSEVYPIAERPERRKPETVKPPKGKPKSPGINRELEPLRQAMLGKGTAIVSVSREDEILECVAEFEKHGIRPVLWGASGATKVVDRIRGRVSGVLTRTSLVTLAREGIPVAFYSAAEEGAAELPTAAAYAVASGLSPAGAVRALTSDAAAMLSIGDRVGRLETGLDADVLLLDASPLELSSRVVRVWVDGEEVR